MRILTIAPTPYFSDRGCHVRIYEEARTLTRLGHEIRIVSYHLGRDMGEIPVLRTLSVPWYRKRSAGPSWHKCYLDILLLFKAMRVARDFAPDLIHAHLHEGAFVGIFLKKHRRIPLLFDCQGSLAGEMAEHRFVRPGSPLFRAFRALERWIVLGADHIVTSASPTAEALCRDFPDRAGRVTPLVDAVDTHEFRPGERDDKLRRLLGIPEGRTVVVYLGAMSEPQGTPLLLEAAKRVVRERQDVHFLLMGYPEEEYRRRACAMGLDGHVTFTGKVDYSRAADYLRLGDIAVSPKLSRTEANGKLFNYMACGLPCVVFDSPVNREILGEAGVYARWGDVGDLSARVAALVGDPPLHKRLASAVREEALGRHAWEGRGRRLEEICAGLLRRELPVRI